MSAEQVLQKEIEKRNGLNREHDEPTYKRDIIKRIKLKNWVLENMKDFLTCKPLALRWI